MKAANSLTSVAQNASFSSIVNSSGMRGMIEKSLGDPVRAARLVSTLISTVSASEQLKACSPDTIVAAALKGEGMNLSLALGQYSIVPFGTTATYVTSYKGYIQLAMRSGMYEDIDAIEIREGEYKGKDARTGKPKLEFIEDDEERESKPIIGYYAFFLLKDGFFKSVYWSRDKVLKHADRYSAAFSLEKYNALINGKLTDSEAAKLSAPWYDTGGQQETMCKKTVLRNLLNSGYAPLSIEMQKAFEMDKQEEEYTPPVDPQKAAPIEVDPSTGEVIPGAQESEQGSTEPPTAAPTSGRRTSKTAQGSFFGE